MTTLNQTMMMILTTIRSEATKAAHSWLAYSRRPTTRRRCRRLMRKAMLLGLASFMTVSLGVEKVHAAVFEGTINVERVYNMGDHIPWFDPEVHVVKSDKIHLAEYSDKKIWINGTRIVSDEVEIYLTDMGDGIEGVHAYEVNEQGEYRGLDSVYFYDNIDIDPAYSDGRTIPKSFSFSLSNIHTDKLALVYMNNDEVGLVFLSFVEGSTTPTASIQTPTIQDQTANISYTASDTTDATIGVYDSLGSLVGTTQSIIADGTNQTVTFADLPAGVYTASIKDGDGTVLATSDTFTISAPLNPVASFSTVSVADQSATFTYSATDTTSATISIDNTTISKPLIDGASQSVTFTDLPIGTHTASIKDGDGTVLATSETFTIANPDATATITLNSDYFGEEENIAVTYQADNIKNGSISLFDKLDNEVTSSQIITADNTTQTVTFQPLSPATYTAKINAVDLNDQTVIFASRPFTVTPQATSTIKLLNQPIYQGQHIIVEYTAENLSSGKMGLYTGIHLIGSDQDVVADGTPHTVTLQSLVAGEYEVRLTGQDLRGEEVTFSSPVTVTVPPPTETPTPTATPTETPTPTATPTETATATPTPVLVLQPPPPAEGYTLLMSGVLTVTGQMEARQSCQWSVDGTPLSITGCTVVLSGPDYAAGDHDLSLNMAGQSQSTTFTVVDDRQRVFLPLLMR